MTRLLTLLLFGILVGCAAEPQRTQNIIRFRATVQDVVLLSSFSGTVTPVDVDPRYALIVRIESVMPGITNFAADSGVTFAIHSPSKLFAEADAKGKTYDFSVRRETEKGKVRYFIQRKSAN